METAQTGFQLASGPHKSTGIQREKKTAYQNIEETKHQHQSKGTLQLLLFSVRINIHDMKKQTAWKNMDQNYVVLPV